MPTILELQYILQTSLDGQWVDGGKFPLSIGAYKTIPKEPQDGAINQEESCYLDIIHVDIAFGDWDAPGCWASVRLRSHIELRCD
jgi:hypothetical protein